MFDWPTLTLNPDHPQPLYRQLYTQLRQLILSGQLAPGAQLPSSRRLAREYQLARITVTQAYEQLQAEGYVTSRVGAGTFVSEELPAAGAPRPFEPHFSAWAEGMLAGKYPRPKSAPTARTAIDFGFGRSFPHIFPYDIWRRLLGRYLSTDDTMLSRYGSAAGFSPLREAVADYLRRLRGVSCTAEQVVIVGGMQQALDLLARLLLNRGDGVLVETPGYVDAFTVFQLAGAQLFPVTVDDHGFSVEKIPAVKRARLVFVTPSNQFPKGGAMPLARRLALLQWARQNDALILEDDYDGELRYSGHPLAALQGLDEEGRVIYLGTFSKVLFPALRLGYVVLPPGLLPAFIQAKQLVDRGAPTLTQAAVADFIREGHFESHLRRLRKVYGRRRHILIAALEQYLGDRVAYAPNPAGLHVMLSLLPHVNEAQLIRQAAAIGVGVYPGATYHLEPSPRPSILLGFSGLSDAEINQGVRSLAEVVPAA